MKVQEKMIRYQRKSNLRSETIGEENQTKKKLRGYPILFDSPAKIGNWTEYVRRGALDGVDLSDLLLVSQHDTAKPLARNGVNMRAVVDDVGLFIEADLPNTRDAHDTYELVSNGVIDGMSYWFEASDVRQDNKKRTMEILKFDKIHEVSVITFPAYREALVIAHEEKNDTQKQNKLLF